MQYMAEFRVCDSRNGHKIFYQQYLPPRSWIFTVTRWVSTQSWQSRYQRSLYFQRIIYQRSYLQSNAGRQLSPASLDYKLPAGMGHSSHSMSRSSQNMKVSQHGSHLSQHSTHSFHHSCSFTIQCTTSLHVGSLFFNMNAAPDFGSKTRGREGNPNKQ